MNAVVALAGGKLSKVVHAMCDGLLAAADRADFCVDMNTYGDTADFDGGRETCYGCAATCTLMKLTGVQLTPSTIVSHSRHADAAGLPLTDVADFERAVDAFRAGHVDGLSPFWNLPRFCDTPRDVVNEAAGQVGYWSLDNSTWREQLPALRQFADFLEANGY